MLYSVISAALVIAIILTWWEAGTFLGLCGIWVSGSGVVLAYAIYIRQAADDHAAEARQQQRLDELAASLVQTVDTDATQHEGEEADAYPEESALMERLGLDIGDRVLRVNAGQVPLTVVSDLVAGWRANGNAGTWRVSTLRAALRKAGKGNHPWYLIFIDPRDDRVRVWRLSKGGRAKGIPTVDEVPLPNHE